jgi:chemotaxis protein MotA
MLAGLAIAAAAMIGGIAFTGVDVRYFLQPTGAIIVLGGTLGVMLISAPRQALLSSLQRVLQLFRPLSSNPEETIETIVEHARLARHATLLTVEPPETRDPFLQRVLAQALALEMSSDPRKRDEFKLRLDAMLRLRSQQGESDARVFETAGGFAPTLGVLGTVVGLIDVFRHFSDLGAVAAGVGMAFVSTIYGLALANLVLLPAAHRVRATLEDSARTDEVIAEGGLGLVDGIRPLVLEERLKGILRRAQSE